VVVVAAFYLLKPSKSKAVLPADLAKQASFRLYYPSPLPPGYTYNQTIATFVNGQAYYEISQGAKHIIVREQSTSASSLDLSSLSSPSDVKTALGKAAVGINTGQTAALVLAGSTLITVNSNGHVPQADMTTFINNLQNLSNP
jgi:homoaconitase/3-isopropylmalate dehydratase large subunit